MKEDMSRLGWLTLDDRERQPCEIWTRVMGYHRPVASFNIGKKGEYRERRFFRESLVEGLSSDEAAVAAGSC